MNKDEYLLTLVQEECAELAHRCAKAQRFGLHECEPGQEESNLKRIVHEFLDLCTCMDLLEDELGLNPFLATHQNAAKMKKLKKYSAYSKAVGCLTELPHLLKE